ncbi:MAG: hypothetical protein LUC43_09065 [Burkholderiales bacterium]|nr:hypothetical protein [Burkholderiales bacterium]
MQNENARSGTTKFPLADTRASVVWSTIMFIFSAGAIAYALIEFTRGNIGECMNTGGLGIVFIGLSFRGPEVAAMAYFQEPERRNEALIKLRLLEKQVRPWLSPLVRFGWIVMIAGIAMQLMAP